MLAWTGFLTIGVILALLLSNRVAAVVALAGVPVVFAFIAGFGPAEIGGFVADGLKGVSGVAVMFIFAIVYFGLMRDAGLFDPIIKRIIRWAGNAPVTIAVATTALAMVAHLDGAGATTFLITIPAMLPLFDRIGMSRLTLSVCVGLGAGTMNLLPWGGPTARAAATTEIPVNELWVPLIPSQVVGILAALGVAWFLGAREQKRLVRIAKLPKEHIRVHAGRGPETSPSNSSEVGVMEPEVIGELNEKDAILRRPRLLWFNASLTVAVLASLISGVMKPELIFVIAVVIALVINYPGLKRQTERIEAHATGAMLMATTLLAAGVFLGILEGTEMIGAMANSAAGLIPAEAAPMLPLIVGILGVPLSLVFGPDAYYFGILPVLNTLGAGYGVPAIEIAQASILGQETVGFPISPLTGSFYLLVGLAGVDIGKHIRALFGWAWLVSLIMLAFALVTGAITLGASV